MDSYKKLKFLLIAVIKLNFYCSRASDYGLMKIEDSGRIVQFSEKPKGSDLNSMVIKFNSLWHNQLMYPIFV